MLGPILGLIAASAAQAAPCAEKNLTFPSGLTVRVDRDCSIAAGDLLGHVSESYLFTAQGEIRTIREAPFSQNARFVFPRNPTSPDLLATGNQVQIRTASGISAVFSIETKRLVSVSGVKLSLDLGTTSSQSLPVEVISPHTALTFTDSSGRTCSALFFELFVAGPAFRFPTDALLREYTSKNCPSIQW